MGGVARWVGRLLPYLVLFALFVFAYVQSVGAQDEFCLSLEQQHLTDVRQLRATYHYLNTLTPEEKGDPLTKRIVDSLPQTEDRARHDIAPPVCDTNKWPVGALGRAEPDPVLPRHQDFRYLLR